MAFSGILEIDGIQGESVVDSHEGKVDITSYNLGVEQTGTGQTGTGFGAGKAQASPVVFSKNMCKASPNLFNACAKGKHIDKIVLSVLKAGGDKPLVATTITLEECFITDFSNQSTDKEIHEVFSVTYNKITYSYQPQDSKTGAASGGAIETTFLSNQSAG